MKHKIIKFLPFFNLLSLLSFNFAPQLLTHLSQLMQIFNDIIPLRDTLNAKKVGNISVGLVPTMGALHEGHLELIKTAKGECDFVVCSIYVNPKQFNNHNDLSKYPRTLEEDLRKLGQENCDYVFCPSNEVMYPKEGLSMNFGRIGTLLEGEFRPGHFDGVGLVVSKLFNIVKPDKAYFGQKDLQQFAIINMLVDSLNFDIELKCVPTIRNNNGLALSSRNMRLTEEGLSKALTLNRAMNYAKSELQASSDFKKIRNTVIQMFNNSQVELEYFEIVDKNTFESIVDYTKLDNAAICVAGYVEGVRLIDNMLLN